MRAVIQRVDQASVAVEDKTVASIKTGYLVFIGIHADDTQKDSEYILNKLLKISRFCIKSAA